MKRMSTYHISLQWSCFSLTLHKETLHTECHYLALLDYIERSWTFYNHIFHVPCINHTEELKIPTTFFVFSGLSRFGLEAISAEQFSDCQVFAPGHFGGWRLIIEFLYSSVLKHARALLAALLLLWQLFFQLGPRPLWGYWRMSRTLRFRLAGHVSPQIFSPFCTFSQKTESNFLPPFPRGPVERHRAELVAIQRGTRGTFPSTFGSEPESQGFGKWQIWKNRR